MPGENNNKHPSPEMRRLMAEADAYHGLCRIADNTDPVISGEIVLRFAVHLHWHDHPADTFAGAGRDLAKEAVLDALPELVGIHHRGPSYRPLVVSFITDEDDLTVEEDLRDEL